MVDLEQLDEEFKSELLELLFAPFNRLAPLLLRVISLVIWLIHLKILLFGVKPKSWLSS